MSTSSGESGDSLLRQVEEYAEGSVSTSRSDELVLLDDEDDSLKVGLAEEWLWGCIDQWRLRDGDKHQSIEDKAPGCHEGIQRCGD